MMSLISTNQTTYEELRLKLRVKISVKVRFRVPKLTVLHITQIVICKVVLHVMHFGVFRYLQDCPAYNHLGYMQDSPACNAFRCFSLFTRQFCVVLVYNPSCYAQDRPVYNISLYLTLLN